MRILSIETSCDETAISLVEATGDFPQAEYKILGNALYSQIDIHREYGGVFPAIAKREHAKTLVPMLKKALSTIENTNQNFSLDQKVLADVKDILEREPGLFEQLEEFASKYSKPDIDFISVTSGPGLEPTLWVGVNFAKALSLLWGTSLVGVNHMEGHVLASVFDGRHLADLQFPALSLLISGGHTELVKMSNWNQYEKIGQTRDDAVGEAFDKVARMLDLPYPGGPEISKLAAEARINNLPVFSPLPRPMLDSGDLDFSFSGLKTAVRYVIQDKQLSENDIKAISRDFEDAVTEVLLKKTTQAVRQHSVKSLILGGGVSANRHIRDTFAEYFKKEYPNLNLYLPDPKLSTDNSIMIALAGHGRSAEALAPDADSLKTIVAKGHLSLSEDTI